jgi:hypothetical protein
MAIPAPFYQCSSFAKVCSVGINIFSSYRAESLPRDMVKKFLLARLEDTPQRSGVFATLKAQ